MDDQEQVKRMQESQRSRKNELRCARIEKIKNELKVEKLQLMPSMD